MHRHEFLCACALSWWSTGRELNLKQQCFAQITSRHISTLIRSTIRYMCVLSWQTLTSNSRQWLSELMLHSTVVSCTIFSWVKCAENATLSQSLTPHPDLFKFALIYLKPGILIEWMTSWAGPAYVLIVLPVPDFSRPLSPGGMAVEHNKIITRQCNAWMDKIERAKQRLQKASKVHRLQPRCARKPLQSGRAPL